MEPEKLSNEAIVKAIIDGQLSVHKVMKLMAHAKETGAIGKSRFKHAKMIGVKMVFEEFENLKIEAEKRGLKYSQLIRLLIRDFLRNQGYETY